MCSQENIKQPRSGIRYIPADEFRRRFRFLILLTWLLPPVVGIGFLLYIRMFSVEQMLVILSGPLVSPFIIGAVFFTLWYFTRFAQPIIKLLQEPRPDSQQVADYQAALRDFPLHYWAAFVVYLVTASTLMVISADIYTGFGASIEIWFRVHLVGLIVSIIVGLPIFFRVLDLFGLTLHGIVSERPVVTMRAKVLMLGAMMPLLVDSLLVQYYWSRTGYFSLETFVVWLALEMIAIVGSLMFMRSLRQSLMPLTRVIGEAGRPAELSVDVLQPYSVDELGVLADSYRRLIRNEQAHRAILAIAAQLNEREPGAGIGASIDDLLQVSQDMLAGDMVIIMLYEADSRELVAVAMTDSSYRKQGYFRLRLDEQSVPTACFREERTQVVRDVSGYPGGKSELCRQMKVRSVLCAPLKISGQTIGVLMTTEIATPRHYDAADVALIEQIASEAAVSISTHWLLEDRMTAQHAAVESETRVRLLLDSTVEAIYGADTEGRCTFVNKACLAMLGYGHEDELLGKVIHELIHHSHPDGSHYPKSECLVRRATLKGEMGHSTDEVHWRKDGTPVPVEFWSHPVYRDGELVGSVVTFIDISERRKAEETLRQLHQRNELLLESTGEGILGVDTALRCTFANQAASRLLGYSREELVGREMHGLLGVEEEPKAAEGLPLGRAIREERAQHTEDAYLCRSDGERIPVEYSANPIHEQGQVTGAVMVFRDVTESRALARKMDYLATHDPLTGLVNRREFEARLEHSLQQTREEDVAHVLCYLDLDQFKIVNDTCGHVAGDELLRQLAALLHTQVRQSDMLARLGGDEFGVLLEGCPVSEAFRIADAMRLAVEDYRFAWEDKTFTIGVSIGMVAITAETESISSAMSAADSACYAAKDSGRNRIHVYEVHDDEMNRRRGEMQWVARLTEALENDRLVLRYQPIVSVQSGIDDGSAFEVLLALQNDDGSTVPPGAFIPAAERYNVMAAIDRWVIAHMCEWLIRHQSELDRLSRCCINLSGQSVGQENFLEFVIEQLSRPGVPADKICFEITETAAVANLSRAVRFIKAVKTFGCRFALDDFGSGMSSFTYLKTLPVDYLKIDGNFVRDMANDPIDRAMVQAIHQVGHVMNIRTIAEFVEDEAVLQELRLVGVDYAQGYGIARPSPLDHYIG